MKDIVDTVTHGDATRLIEQVPDGSIDLVFTDPPYPKAYLHLYEWLSTIGDKIKSDGFLMTYVGGYWKNKIIAMFDKRMDYFWDYTLGMPGNNSVIWPRKTIARAKSILCYRPRNGDGMPRYNVIDLWIGSKQDKRFHTWGQEESAARYFIESFTGVGDVVLDPFAGGGTTAAMSKMLNRRFITFEIDDSAVQIAVKRIENQQMQLPMDGDT